MLTDEYRYKILRLLEENPQLSQRDLAERLGISLGKANYCLNALIEKGHVKLRNFRKNPDKRQYAYLLTNSGVREKTRITLAFLRRKLTEYETLEKEIAELRRDLAGEALRGERGAAR